MSSKNPFISATIALVALAITVLFVTPSDAATRPLSEREMSDVRGADGTLGAPLQGLPGGSGNSLSSGLSAAFASSTGGTVLDATQFDAALVAAGYTPSMIAGYDGQAVVQTRVDAAPVTFSFGADALLQTVGLTYNAPSMGTFTLKDFDARGTTLWVWQHH